MIVILISFKWAMEKSRSTLFSRAARVNWGCRLQAEKGKAEFARLVAPSAGAWRRLLTFPHSFSSLPQWRTLHPRVRTFSGCMLQGALPGVRLPAHSMQSNPPLQCPGQFLLHCGSDARTVRISLFLIFFPSCLIYHLQHLRLFWYGEIFMSVFLWLQKNYILMHKNNTEWVKIANWEIIIANVQNSYVFLFLNTGR